MYKMIPLVLFDVHCYNYYDMPFASLAYVFDISSPLTKIPSVILLLLLGWIVKAIH